MIPISYAIVRGVCPMAGKKKAQRAITEKKKKKRGRRANIGNGLEKVASMQFKGPT